MHFCGTGFTHHFDNLNGGCPTDDGVINQYDPLALYMRLVGVVLAFDTELAHGLCGFNECPSDIMVPDDAQFKGDPGFFGISNGSRYTAVRHRDDDISVNTALLGKYTAEILAAVINAAAIKY